jgi:hypothetical protein
MPQDDRQRCADEPRDEVRSVGVDQDEHVYEQNVGYHREHCECPEERGFSEEQQGRTEHLRQPENGRVDPREAKVKPRELIAGQVFLRMADGWRSLRTRPEGQRFM